MAIRISAVKSSRLSEDKKEVIVASSGKYTGELELRFACECIDDLISALTKARATVEPIATSGVAQVATSTAQPATSMEKQSKVAASDKADEIRFEIPRNFTITADTSGRGLVLVIVNHRLDRQAGYALSPDAAKQLAGGLVKSADALISSKAAATKN